MRKLLLIATFSLLIAVQSGQGQKSGDIDATAQFIWELREQVRISSDSSDNDANSFEIGIIDNLELEKAIAALTGDMLDKKNDVVVSACSYDDDLAAFDLVYFATEDLEKLAALLKMVNGKPVITVTDTKGYARYGVMFELFIKDGRAAYEMNKSVMRRAGLEPSEKLVEGASKTYGR